MRNIDITKYFLPAFQPLVFDKHYQILCFGGRGGGKSVNAAARKMIFRMQTDGRVSCVCLRKNEKDHSTSTYEELKKAITAYSDLIYDTAFNEELESGKSELEAKKIAAKEKQDYLSLWKYNTSPLKITYLPCGNKIVFKGFNDPVSIKSTTTDDGTYCLIWLEEGESIESKIDFDEAMDSFRGEMPEGLYLQVIITFNSPFNNHWLKEEADNAGMKVNFPNHKYINEYYPEYTYPSISLIKGGDKNTLAHYSVYTENPKLSQLDRERYERTALSNPAYYRWKYLGEFGSKTGRVMNNFEIVDFDIREVIKPKDWYHKSKFKIYGGLDLGFIHPTAFYMHAVNKETHECYVFDGFSRTGITNSEIAGMITSMGYRKEKIITENAEPRTLKDLKSENGLSNIKPVHKYKGGDSSSIMQGIKIMWKYKIYIKPELKDYINCISNWCWEEDKNGRPLERPVNIDDDEITCMTKDTMVLTINGYKNIDTIKSGEIILTYNEKTKKFEHNQVEISGKTKENAEIYEMELEDGTIMKLTPNHKLLTKDGWKQVKNIVEGDDIICYNQNQ